MNEAGKLKNSNNDELKRKEKHTEWLVLFFVFILERGVSGAAWNLWGVVSGAALGGRERTSEARRGAEILIAPLLASSGMDKQSGQHAAT